jgi:hypothetical protein
VLVSLLGYSLALLGGGRLPRLLWCRYSEVAITLKVESLTQ